MKTKTFVVCAPGKNVPAFLLFVRKKKYNLFFGNENLNVTSVKCAYRDFPEVDILGSYKAQTVVAVGLIGICEDTEEIEKLG